MGTTSQAALPPFITALSSRMQQLWDQPRSKEEKRAFLIATAVGAFGCLGITTTILWLRVKRQRALVKDSRSLKELRGFVLEEVLTDHPHDGFCVLLGHFTWQSEGAKAILKIKSKNLSGRPGTGSAQTLWNVWDDVTLRLTMESGSEYAYYVGTVGPQALVKAGIPLSYHVEVICPASERQIARERPEDKYLVRETGDLYHEVISAVVQSVRGDGKSLQWVYNILDHKKEVNRVVYEDPDPVNGFMLMLDPKWKSHPNPDMVPKTLWKHDASVQHLACLAICHDRSIICLRDLRRRHLPLLKGILDKGSEALKDVYGIDPRQLRVYVHYLPQFFHFHVHFSRVSVSMGVEVERAHLLADIIRNIEEDPTDTYYERASISYSVKANDRVFRALYGGST